MQSYAPGEMDGADPRAAVIHQMVSDLGWCLNSYGQIEFLFGDVVWHAARLPEYEAVAKPFPHGLDNRLDRLGRLLAMPGRLAPYADDLRLLTGRLRHLSESRHLFVHGHCTFVFTKAGDAAMIFRRFKPPAKGGEYQRVEEMVRPASLQHARFLWCVFASTAQRIIGSMYVDLGLEEIGKGSPRA